MKRILFACKNMNIGGVEKSLLSLLNTIDRSNYEVDLLLLEDYGGFMSSIPEWVHVIICKDYAAIKDEVNLPPAIVVKDHFRAGKIGRALTLTVAYLKTKICRNYSCYYEAVFRDIPVYEKEYDIAVSYTSIIGYLTWLVIHHVRAKEYIGWIHFDVSKISVDSTMLLQLHKNMKRIYVVSQTALDAFTQMFPQLTDKCELRYNVVDQDTILKMAEERAESIKTAGKKTIITLGRLTTEKGQDIIPEVARLLINDGYHFTWYLIGDGGLRTEIEKAAKRLHVENYVIMLGTKQNPYPYLKQADLYVQTSIYEGRCIAIDEAKVFCTKIIATEVSGIHEQLDNCDTCCIVERDANAIKNAVVRLWD